MRGYKINHDTGLDHRWAYVVDYVIPQRNDMVMTSHDDFLFPRPHKPEIKIRIPLTILV